MYQSAQQSQAGAQQSQPQAGENKKTYDVNGEKVS
jgi:hypothetical protein